MNFLNKSKILPKVISLSFFIFLSLMLVLPVVSVAQSGGAGGPPVGGGGAGGPPVGSGVTTIENPISATTVNGLIKDILVGVIKIGIPIVALAIIYSGFLFVSAQGNQGKLTEAKNALLYTLIGAAILLGSWALAQLISDTVLSL